jgi:hypothetical protein
VESSETASLRSPRIAAVNPAQRSGFNAFVEWQNQKQLGNHVVMFINRTMNPVQYTARQDLFESRRDELNVVLAFCGLSVGADGKVRQDVRLADLPGPGTDCGVVTGPSAEKVE